MLFVLSVPTNNKYKNSMIRLPSEKTSPCTGFSVVIPTWLNRDYLKVCLESIEKNSLLKNEILIHVNDGSDGTIEYLREKGIPFSQSAENIGICYSVNQAAARATKEWILYLNDDMYCCPGWDKKLAECVNKLGHDACMVSATMIEPIETGNACVSVADFGRGPDNFKEKELLASLGSLTRSDWLGATWPPNVIHRRWWNAIGGLSSEFSPGMSSDNDLSMKMWHAGCRVFLGVGNSLVYHFISKSTGRIKKNDGRRQFLQKWGLPQSAFDRYYLKRGKPVEKLELSEVKVKGSIYFQVLRAKLKSFF